MSTVDNKILLHHQHKIMEPSQIHACHSMMDDFFFFRSSSYAWNLRGWVESRAYAKWIYKQHTARFDCLILCKNKTTHWIHHATATAAATVAAHTVEFPRNWTYVRCSRCARLCYLIYFDVIYVCFCVIRSNGYIAVWNAGGSKIINKTMCCAGYAVCIIIYSVPLRSLRTAICLGFSVCLAFVHVYTFDFSGRLTHRASNIATHSIVHANSQTHTKQPKLKRKELWSHVSYWH